MPKFSIQHQSKLSKADAYAKIKNFLGSETELSKLAPGAKAQFTDSSQSGNISGPGFKANVELQDTPPGSQVTVHVDLGLLLTPLKGKVEEVLKKKLAQHLG